MSEELYGNLLRLRMLAGLAELPALAPGEVLIRLDHEDLVITDDRRNVAHFSTSMEEGGENE